MIEAHIRGDGKRYANGLEPLFVNVPRESASGLPFEDNQRVPITLEVLGHTYQAGLRATPDNPGVWISPDVLDSSGNPTNLAEVFRSLGFERNDRVLLSVEGNVVTLSRAAS